MERACRSCAEPDNPPSAVSIAVVVLIAIVVIYYFTKWLGGTRDGFVSRRAQEVYQASQELFSRTGGNASFSEFKTAAPGAEAVLYTDARSLWKQGKLTPEAVEKVL
jgi:hypothetical protein